MWTKQRENRDGSCLGHDDPVLLNVIEVRNNMNAFCKLFPFLRYSAKFEKNEAERNCVTMRVPVKTWSS